MNKRETGIYDTNGTMIKEGDLVRRTRTTIGNITEIIGVGRVCWGQYFHSYCDEYECDHYGWYIDFAINTGYVKNNTGYPLWVSGNCRGEKNEIIGSAHNDLVYGMWS